MAGGRGAPEPPRDTGMPQPALSLESLRRTPPAVSFLAKHNHFDEAALERM
jgi:hypothetical protein